MVLSKNKVDPAAAEKAFTAIFAPTPGKIFVWFNQFQVHQTAEKVAGCYGFALSSSVYIIFVHAKNLILPNQ